MNRALVCIDDVFFRPLTELALIARELGYRTAVITKPLREAQREQMQAFEEEHLQGAPVFDRILETSFWDLDTLRDLVLSLEEGPEPLSIAGFITGGGVFNADGLLGANVATLAEERGLRSQNSDAIYRANNKYLMRDALHAAGVPCVDFGLAADERSLLTEAERIGYPVILKPLTGGSSHLILKCENEAQLRAKFQLALERLPTSLQRQFYSCAHTYRTKNGRSVYFDPMRMMLIESYLTGREASVEVVVTNDDVIPLLVHDKVVMTEGERVFYEHLLVVPPMRFTEAEISAMKAYARSAVKALGLRNCVCHVELRYDDLRGPQILEINPRVGGMYIADNLRALVGFDEPRASVELALGLFEPAPAYTPAPDLYGMFAVYPPHAGLFEACEGMEQIQALPGVLDVRLRARIGSVIGGDDEEVFLFTCWMKGETYDAIFAAYDLACKAVTFTITRQTPAAKGG